MTGAVRDPLDYDRELEFYEYIVRHVVDDSGPPPSSGKEYTKFLRRHNLMNAFKEWVRSKSVKGITKKKRD